MRSWIPTLFIAAALTTTLPAPAATPSEKCASKSKAVDDAKTKRDAAVAVKVSSLSAFKQAAQATDQAFQAFTAKRANTKAALGAYRAALEATGACRKANPHKQGACSSQVSAETSARASWLQARKDEGTAKGAIGQAKTNERNAERQLESAVNKLVAAQTQLGNAVIALSQCTAKYP